MQAETSAPKYDYVDLLAGQPNELEDPEEYEQEQEEVRASPSNHEHTAFVWPRLAACMAHKSLVS